MAGGQLAVMDSAFTYVHLLLAYLHLSLGDFLRTLTHTRKVLSTTCEDNIRWSMIASTTWSVTTHIARFLAQTYAVESLCGLGQPEQAEQFIEVELLAVPETLIPFNHIILSWGIDGSPPFEACDAPHVIRTMNIAVVRIFQGHLGQAESQLTAIIAQYPKFFPAVRCLAYVYLRQKNMDSVLRLLAAYNAFPINSETKI